MSTIIIPGGTGGITVGSIVTTAVNIAILYFLFLFVSKNWNTVSNVMRIPVFGMDVFNVKREKFLNMKKAPKGPKTSVGVFLTKEGLPRKPKAIYGPDQ